MIFADVDLLDLVLDDHHEPCDLSGDLGDRRVGQSLLGPTPEGVLGARGGQLVRNVSEVPVLPAPVPDRSD